MIIDGEADVTTGGRQIATIGAGDFFGEIALLERVERTATVTAQLHFISSSLATARSSLCSTPIRRSSALCYGRWRGACSRSPAIRSPRNSPYRHEHRRLAPRIGRSKAAGAPVQIYVTLGSIGERRRSAATKTGDTRTPSAPPRDLADPPSFHELSRSRAGPPSRSGHPARSGPRPRSASTSTPPRAIPLARARTSSTGRSARSSTAPTPVIAKGLPPNANGNRTPAGCRARRS